MHVFSYQKFSAWQKSLFPSSTGWLKKKRASPCSDSRHSWFQISLLKTSHLLTEQDSHPRLLLFLFPFIQSSIAPPAETPASRPKRCSAAAAASLWGTKSSTAACPVMSWTDTQLSPASPTPETLPCGTSLRQSVEVRAAKCVPVYEVFTFKEEKNSQTESYWFLLHSKTIIFTTKNRNTSYHLCV